MSSGLEQTLSELEAVAERRGGEERTQAFAAAQAAVSAAIKSVEALAEVDKCEPTAKREISAAVSRLSSAGKELREVLPFFSATDDLKAQISDTRKLIADQKASA